MVGKFADYFPETGDVYAAAELGPINLLWINSTQLYWR